MIKGFFATIGFLSIFFAGMNYALLHPKIAKQFMVATFGCSYTPGSRK